MCAIPPQTGFRRHLIHSMRREIDIFIKLIIKSVGGALMAAMFAFDRRMDADAALWMLVRSDNTRSCVDGHARCGGRVAAAPLSDFLTFHLAKQRHSIGFDYIICTAQTFHRKIISGLSCHPPQNRCFSTHFPASFGRALTRSGGGNRAGRRDANRGRPRSTESSRFDRECKEMSAERKQEKESRKRVYSLA